MTQTLPAVFCSSGGATVTHDININYSTAVTTMESLLAEMLGVQRPTVTNAAGELERAGLIERGRQQVTILDRQGLIEASCECYKLVRARVASHLPKTYV
jgi:Mn-dependent DtxR family transcriptional regulator